MHHNIRIFKDTTDVTAQLNDWRSGHTHVHFDMSGATYLYIGQEMPFNNLWFEIQTANDVVSAASIDIWYANDWIDAVDVYDGTASSSGAALAQDGRLSWNTPWNKGWDLADRSELVTGLTGTNVYDMYWIRLSYSATLKVNTAVHYLGQKFARDLDIYTYYPDLNNSNLKAAYTSGKTDWEEQCYAATQVIIRDLTSREIIHARGQIVDWELMNEACCHQAAAIIYGALGVKFRPNRDEALKQYGASMQKKLFRVDKDGDARLSITEKRHSQRFASR